MIQRGAIGLAALLLLATSGPQFIVRTPPAPTLISLSVTSGPVGTTVVLSGTGFQSTQGSGSVVFLTTVATPTVWSDTSITVTVPIGAVTGDVHVNTVNGPSNRIAFTVTISAACAGSVIKTIKPGGGGDFTTITAFNAAAAPGWTADIFAGSYAGFTPSTNGTAGNPITYCGEAGYVAQITSTITITGKAFLTFTHLRLTAGMFIGCETGAATNQNNQIVDILATGAGSNFCGVEGTVALWGSNNLVDQIVNLGPGAAVDCFQMGGANNVLRRSTCKNINGAGGSNHVDFFQQQGGANPVLSFSLLEDNVEQNAFNDAGNNHFILSRTSGSPVGQIADTILVRYNYAQSLDASGAIAYGGVGDNVPNGKFYHNTIAEAGSLSGNGCGASWQNASNGAAINNIFYKDCSNPGNPWSPVYDFSTGNGVMAQNTGNIGFVAGFSGNWQAAYQAEPTYAALKNQDPLFANYPTDCTLQGGSPAAGVGQPLTTVAAGDSGSGSSLILNDAHFFQPGWAGTQGDVIRLGSTAGSPRAQITAINYSTNTLTLSSAPARSAATPIYLYANSSGSVKIAGTLPNIGACQ